MRVNQNNLKERIARAKAANCGDPWDFIEYNDGVSHIEAIYRHKFTGKTRSKYIYNNCYIEPPSYLTAYKEDEPQSLWRKLF